uniref:Capsid n=3 Tax=Human calicivirus NLV/VA97207/1997 TaxID=165510 RepID=Q91H09_NORV|nr:capsid [Human calicivirus NLV/VA97207/1997]
MKMASNDAAPSSDGAAGVVPEINHEVMAIEPVAGASIAAPVVGQQNIIDPWIRNNFVQAPAGEFTVSPRNAPGEFLLDLELGPDLNPYLAHLARMYNGHAGGMEVQIVLAGNAFTAGKILFAVIPPGFPYENLCPAQLTMCPHVVVDVRQLEPVMLPMPDIRNTFFHYNQDGGPKLRLIAMLYTPLRANNSGDDVFTVSCRVLTRPAPDFEFTFLVPPSIESKTKAFTIPVLKISEMTNSRFPVPVDQMYTSRSEGIVVQPQNGRATIDGELLGTTLVSPVSVCNFKGNLQAEVPGQHQLYQLQLTNLDGSPIDPTDDTPGPLGCPDFTGLLYGVASQRGPGDATRAHEARIDTGSDTFAPKIGQVRFYSTSSDFETNQPTHFTPIGIYIEGNSSDFNQWQLPRYGGHLANNNHLAPAVSPLFPGEQILFFRSFIPGASGHTNGEMDCLLPQEFVQHFYQEAATARSEVALLRFVNPDTGRALFESKLHKQGFMTIASSGDHPIIMPTNGYFRFEAWVNQFYSLAPVGTGSGRRRIQ